MRLSSLKNKLVSSGGIVYRFCGDEIEVVVCCRNEPQSCNLPKGTPESSETMEETALREVREETGLEVNIEKYVGEVCYEFFSAKDQVMVEKSVFYYLMIPVGGSFELHDHEFDDVSWINVDEINTTLTYQNEVEIVQKGISLVKR